MKPIFVTIHNGIISNVKAFKAYFAQIHALKNHLDLSGLESSKHGLLITILDNTVLAGVFIMLGHFRAFTVAENVPYVFFVVTGITIWVNFSEILVHALRMQTVLANISSGIKVSPAQIMALIIYEKLNSVTIRFFVVLAIGWFYYGLSWHGIGMSALITALSFFLGLFLGLLLAPLTSQIVVLRQIINMILRVIMYISNVVFPLPVKSAAFLWWFNPIPNLLDYLRFSWSTPTSAIEVTVLVLLTLILVPMCQRMINAIDRAKDK